MTPPSPDDSPSNPGGTGRPDGAGPTPPRASATAPRPGAMPGKPTNARPSTDASRLRVLREEQPRGTERVPSPTPPTPTPAPTPAGEAAPWERPTGAAETRGARPGPEPGGPATPTLFAESGSPTMTTGAIRTSVPPMVRPSTPRPRQGWRALAYGLTGGLWNPGIGPREERTRTRERQIATQLRGKHVTAFFCLKGGISKTSTTAATSIALADLRPDPVFAIDANPDAGDLAERLVGEKLSGIAALARDIESIDSLEALSRYTATSGRLTMLPGEPSPILGDSLSADDFEAVMRVVQRYYSFVQVDCGTGVTHPLMEGVLRFADTAVIPAAWSVTGAKRAAESIQWLADHGFERLARTCIVVLTAKDIVSSAVDKDAVLGHLSRAADVIVVPADPHVADGALLEWEQLQPATREAYLDIAAAITARFGTA